MHYTPIKTARTEAQPGASDHDGGPEQAFRAYMHEACAPLRAAAPNPESPANSTTRKTRTRRPRRPEVRQARAQGEPARLERLGAGTGPQGPVRRIKSEETCGARSGGQALAASVREVLVGRVGGPRRGVRSAAVHLAPDALAAPSGCQPQRSASPSTSSRPRPLVSSPSACRGAGGRALESATSSPHRCPAPATARAEQHAQHGRTAGVHHGVGDELGDRAGSASRRAARRPLSRTRRAANGPTCRARPTSAGSGRTSNCT